MESELTQEILKLQPGDHLCLFYEKDPAEQMPALIPFIQDGLCKDEQFIYIADDQTVGELEAQLQQSGINVGKESDRGALKLWTRREWRQPGELSSQKKSLQVLDFINAAAKSGFKGSRFAVEMTWALGPDISADLLEHWEATLNTIFLPGFRRRIACQYNRSRLSPEVMLAALHTHPLAVLGNHVYQNFFYEAPLLLDRNDNDKPTAARVNWMISQLERARAAERERKKLEEQLRHAQKMETVGTLAGGVAHDFNNVLNIIKGYSVLISRHSSADEKIVESLKVIDEAIERGASVVQQLLTIARKSEANLAATNLNHVISDLSKLLKQTFPKTIDVVFDIDPKLPAIMADSNQISQALLNLCVNVRDAMPAGGTITLRSKLVDGKKVPNGHAGTKTDQYVCIEVIDTGSGMDANVRSRIFEPFFTTKGIGQGTGLGLAMVYGIVKNHNGFVDVESESGRGATFRLYLPVIVTEEKPSSRQGISRELSHRATHRGTVLLAEDEKPMARVLERILKESGHQVLIAQNGEEALDLYDRHKEEIDVVLLDIGLPKIAGWDVVPKIKEKNPNANVVMTSGYIEPAVKSKMYQLGVKDFIYKPYTPEAIVETVEALIEKHSIH